MLGAAPVFAGARLMATDVSDLRESVSNWANDAAGQALDQMGQDLRDRAPYGASEGGHDGPHLVDTLETTITSQGEVWTGEIAFTAEHASFVSEGTSPHEIQGNPLLAFPFGGGTVIVHSVQHPGSPANPFFTEGVTEDTWSTAVESALDQVSPG